MDEQFRKQGFFSWCELLTDDVAAAKAFYATLFGWTFVDNPMGMDYTLIRAEDKEIGGIMAIPEAAKGMPPSWGTYVTVDDVDAVAEKAVELGGKVLVPPRDIPEVGRFCVIRDPRGAMISAIAYKPCEGS